MFTLEEHMKATSFYPLPRMIGLRRDSTCICICAFVRMLIFRMWIGISSDKYLAPHNTVLKSQVYWDVTNITMIGCTRLGCGAQYSCIDFAVPSRVILVSTALNYTMQLRYMFTQRLLKTCAGHSSSCAEWKKTGMQPHDIASTIAGVREGQSPAGIRQNVELM